MQGEVLWAKDSVKPHVNWSSLLHLQHTHLSAAHTAGIAVWETTYTRLFRYADQKQTNTLVSSKRQLFETSKHETPEEEVRGKKYHMFHPGYQGNCETKRKRRRECSWRKCSVEGGESHHALSEPKVRVNYTPSSNDKA